MMMVLTFPFSYLLFTNICRKMVDNLKCNKIKLMANVPFVQNSCSLLIISLITSYCKSSLLPALINSKVDASLSNALTAPIMKPSVAMSPC